LPSNTDVKAVVTAAVVAASAEADPEVAAEGVADGETEGGEDTAEADLDDADFEPPHPTRATSARTKAATGRSAARGRMEEYVACILEPPFA
jgi:hypothetical protein